MNNIKLGFIGYGNMAQSLAEGFLYKGTLKPEHIYACAKNWDKLCSNTQLMGIQPCKTAQETAENADVVILAVKPYMIQEVVEPIKEILQKKIVISVAAGYPFEKYEGILLPNTHHLSTIPNTPVSVGEGIIICENKHSLSTQECEMVNELFSKIALVQYVDSKQLSIGGTISGCGPAFASMFLEALGDAGVLHGLSRDAAYKLAAQMMTGTGKLYLESGVHPGEMKDSVCSPGGTTIRGVAALEKNGLRSAIIEAVSAIEGE